MRTPRSSGHQQPKAGDTERAGPFDTSKHAPATIYGEVDQLAHICIVGQWSPRNEETVILDEHLLKLPEPGRTGVEQSGRRCLTRTPHSRRRPMESGTDPRRSVLPDFD